MAILDDVKISLRISNTAYDTEITDLINACIDDLGLSGVLDTTNTDPLIKRAINTYVKANFGFDNPDAIRLQQAYDMLKAHLSLSLDYARYAVVFTVVDTNTDAIREVEITFAGTTLETDENGMATFYSLKGSNIDYTVSKNGYITQEDILDITASTSVNITLLEV